MNRLVFLLFLWVAMTAHAQLRELRLRPNGTFVGGVVDVDAGQLTIGGVAVGGGISDGDKGDITVSASGATLTIDSGAFTFAELGSKPTTLGGYGITDAVPTAQVWVRSTLGGFTAYSTVTAAIAAATSGQTVTVGPGTRDEQIAFKNGVNIELVGAHLTYSGASGAALHDNGAAVTCSISGFGTISRSGSGSGDVAVIKTTGASNINIKGNITVTNTATGGSNRAGFMIDGSGQFRADVLSVDSGEYDAVLSTSGSASAWVTANSITAGDNMVEWSSSGEVHVTAQTGTSAGEGYLAYAGTTYLDFEKFTANNTSIGEATVFVRVARMSGGINCNAGTTTVCDTNFVASDEENLIRTGGTLNVIGGSGTGTGGVITTSGTVNFIGGDIPKTAIGSSVQGYSANLASLEAVVSTATGRSLLAAANAAAGRVVLELGNVNNTSDANKPISSATQTALDAKQPLAASLTTVAGGDVTSVGVNLIEQGAVADMRSFLELGTMATETAVNYPTLTGANTLTNKTLTSPVLNGTVSGTAVGTDANDLMQTDSVGNAPAITGQILVLRSASDVTYHSAVGTTVAFNHNGVAFVVPAGKVFVMTGGRVFATTYANTGAITQPAVKFEDSTGVQFSTGLTTNTTFNAAGRYNSVAIGGNPTVVPAGRSMRLNITVQGAGSTWTGPATLEGYLMTP